MAEMKAVNEEKTTQERKKAHAIAEFWEADSLPLAEATKKPSSMTSENFFYRK